VVGRRPGLGVDLGGDDTSIGLRRADHGVATTLTRVVGPLATTSANRHGSPPVTTAGELLAALPGVAVVVDGGRCEGAPSTVVDVRGSTPRLLRAGAAPWDEIGAGGGWGSSQSRPRI
jgi:tRNA A37 threonylcarbamoyladenosine synthetase subunit TsaC/SUA5/YrdC